MSKKSLDSDKKGTSTRTTKAVVPPVVWVVENGVSITSLRGVLEGGAEVSADFFSGGEESLQSLIKAGLVVKLDG